MSNTGGNGSHSTVPRSRNNVTSPLQRQATPPVLSEEFLDRSRTLDRSDPSSSTMSDGNSIRSDECGILNVTTIYIPASSSESSPREVVSDAEQQADGQAQRTGGNESPVETDETPDSPTSRVPKAALVFGFVPLEIITKLGDTTNWRHRAEGVEELNMLVRRHPYNEMPKGEYLKSFMSHLMTIFDDSNFKVVLTILNIISELFRKCGKSMQAVLPELMEVLSLKLGDTKIVIRQAHMGLLMEAMSSLGPQVVLNHILPTTLGCHSWRVREEGLNVLTAALLKFPRGDMSLEVCSVLAVPALVDDRSRVRQAAMECVAVLGHVLGDTNTQPLVSTVTDLEHRTNSFGVLNAVLSRLSRRQIPQITSEGLIEHRIPVATSSTAADRYRSSDNLDVLWVLNGRSCDSAVSSVASTPVQATTPIPYPGGSSRPDSGVGRHKESRMGSNSTMATPTPSDIPPVARPRFSSAGRQQIPWRLPSRSDSDVPQYDSARDKTRSAPLQLDRLNSANGFPPESMPPLVSRKSWQSDGFDMVDFKLPIRNRPSQLQLAEARELRQAQEKSLEELGGVIPGNIRAGSFLPPLNGSRGRVAHEPLKMPEQRPTPNFQRPPLPKDSRPRQVDAVKDGRQTGMINLGVLKATRNSQELSTPAKKSSKLPVSKLRQPQPTPKRHMQHTGSDPGGTVPKESSSSEATAVGRHQVPEKAMLPPPAPVGTEQKFSASFLASKERRMRKLREQQEWDAWQRQPEEQPVTPDVDSDFSEWPVDTTSTSSLSSSFTVDRKLVSQQEQADGLAKAAMQEESPPDVFDEPETPSQLDTSQDIYAEDDYQEQPFVAEDADGVPVTVSPLGHLSPNRSAARKPAGSKKRKDQLSLSQPSPHKKPALKSSTSTDTEYAVEPVVELTHPSGALTDCMRLLSGGSEWEAVCDGLNTVRNLAAFHVDVLSPQLSIVLKGIIREVKNPRSSVSRLAMHTLDDLYMNLGKLMDPHVELTGSALLQRCSEMNTFLKMEAEGAIRAMTNFANPLRAAAVLSNFTSHKNAAVRKVAAMAMVWLLERLTPQKAMRSKEMCDILIPAIITYGNDKDGEARYHAKKCAALVMEVGGLAKFAPKSLSSTLRKQMEELVTHIEKKGIGELPSIARRNSLSLARQANSLSLSNGASSMPTGQSGVSSVTAPVLNQLGMSRSSSIDGIAAKAATTRTAMRRAASDSGAYAATPVKVQLPEKLLKALVAQDVQKRENAITSFTDLAFSKPMVVSTHFIKLFDAFMPRVNDANSKISRYAFNCLCEMLDVPELTDVWPQILQHLVPAAFNGIASRHESIRFVADEVVQKLTSSISGHILLPHVCHTAQFGNKAVKAKAIDTAADIFDSCYANYPQSAKRHALPLVYHCGSLLNGKMTRTSEILAPMSPVLRMAIAKLVHFVFERVGSNLFSDCKGKATVAELNHVRAIIKSPPEF